MPELLIVGGGPAGLTAAVYGLRQRRDVLLVAEELGGKANLRQRFPGVEEDRVIRGADLVERFRNEVGYLTAAHRLARVQGLRRAGREGFVASLAGGEEVAARAVILATGSRAQALRLPGAERYAFKGLGFSALGYAHLFLERTVVVIGSGRRAVAAALLLAGAAREVHLVAAPGCDLRPALAGAHGKAALRRPNLRQHPDAEALELRGDHLARELSLRSAAEARGPEASAAAETAEETLRADGFFLLGEPQGNTEVLASLRSGPRSGPRVDGYGRLQVDAAGATSLPGLFAAGDVTAAGCEQILVAIGEGAKAALSAIDWLGAS